MQGSSSIKKIIEELENYNLLEDIINPDYCSEIKGISIDSRKVEDGYIFICIRGYNIDGHNYAKEAVQNGANIIVCEEILELDVCQIIVNNSRKAEAVIASFYYGTKEHSYKLIGITGTNGKTTISYLIAEILTKLGYRCGIIGTLGYKIQNELYSLDRTTPDAIELHKILSKMRELDYVVMEVSSHSLVLERVYGLNFHIVIFTNLTHEHLDFHKNIENYANSKYKLFSLVDKKEGVAIFNIDDYYGERFFNKYEGKKVSLSFEEGDYSIKNMSLSSTGTSFNLQSGNSKEIYKTKLIGRFNIYNLSLSIIATKILVKPDYEILKKVIMNLTPPTGRLQKVFSNKNVHIFVDYAHTPDALKNVLEALNEIKTKRIITIFGAGGNRDKKKRNKMYIQALKQSDIVIVTTDNPRFENPISIINDILSDHFDKSRTLIFENRKEAIRCGIKIAKNDDIVLIAGKGHETYQEIEGKKYSFNDYLIAKEVQEERNRGNLYIPISKYWLYKIFDKEIDENFKDEVFYNIFTDSRKVINNSIFFAFQGEKYDGHDFMDDVLRLKNTVVIANKNSEISGERIINVDNTIEAFGYLAKFYKRVFNPYTIAITGSNGKTTTKEFVYNVFTTTFSVHKSYKNENNFIGVPKTIFNYQNQDYLICELGTNHKGEIEYLSKIVEPDLSIITNIGNSHIEFFKDKKGVFEEKRKLLDNTKKIKIVDGDDEYLKMCDAIKVGYNYNNDYRINNVKIENDKTKFNLNKMEFKILTPFKVFVKNSSFAIVAGLLQGLKYEVIKEAIKRPVDIPLRMQIVKRNGIIFLNDCYNANPDSMIAAIDFWKDYQKDEMHIAVLGDMLELGENSIKFHKLIGKRLSNIKNVRVYSIGKYSKYYYSKRHYKDVDSFLNDNIIKTFPIGSVVLIKASHSLGLDRILRSI